MKSINFLAVFLFVLIFLISDSVQEVTVKNATFTTRLAQVDALDGQWEISFYELEFSENISFSLDSCPPTSCCDSSTPSTIPCCVECEGPVDNRTATDNPLNSLGCACSRTDTSLCIDSTAPVDGSFISNSKGGEYEVNFVAQPCNNILIFLETITGEQQLIIYSTADNFTSERSRSNFGSDGLEYCCDQNSVNRTGDFLFIQVVDVIPGDYRIHVIESTASHPNFNLDMGKYWSLAAYTVTCDGFHPMNPVYHPDVLLTVPPAKPDVAYNFLSAFSDQHASNAIEYASNTLTFAIVQTRRFGGVLRALFTGDVTSCRIETGGLPAAQFTSVSASGDVTPFPASLKAKFKPGFIPCDPAAFYKILDQVDDVYAQLGNTTDLEITARLSARAGALMGGNAWYGCYQHVLSLLDIQRETRIIPNTIGCYAEAGTDDYIKDPCCNTSLTFEYCCSARDVRVYNQTTYRANTKVIEEQCLRSECTKQLLEDSNDVVDAFFNGVCTTPQTLGLINQAYYGHQVLQDTCRTRAFEAQRCQVDSDCLSGRCEDDGDCQQAQDFHEAMRFFALCLLTSDQSVATAQLKVNYGEENSSIDDYLENFLKKYNSTGCVSRAGVSFSGKGSDEDNCLADRKCNWDPSITNETECLYPFPWLGGSGGGLTPNNYCGRCDNKGLCSDVTQQPGCHGEGTWGITQEICDFYAGVWVANVCFFPRIQNQTICKPLELCGDSDDDCPSFCYWNITQANCRFPPSRAPYRTVKNLTWNNQTKLCTASLVDMNTCENVTRGKYWRGGGWVEDPRFSSSDDCTHSCSFRNVPEGECRKRSSCSQKCSNPCDQEKCEKLGRCNDDELKPNGRCYFPFSYNADGQAYCSNSKPFTTQVQFGCLAAKGMTIDKCQKLGGRFVMPATNQSTCESYFGCTQISTNGTTVVTLKSAQQCANCGGVSHHLFKWTPAKWTSGQLQALTWQPRSLVSTNLYTWHFDSASYLGDYNPVSAQLLAQATVSELSCRYNRINQMIKQVVCDCVNKTEQACYTKVQSQPLGFTRFCSNLPLNFTVFPVTLMTYNDTQYSSGCNNIEIGMIEAAVFKQDKSTALYSSLFFASLERNQYAVIQNEDKQRVGQLAANGISVDFNGYVVGNVTLCVDVLSIEIQSNYKHPDWALLSTDKKYFKVMNITGMTYDKTTDQICGPINSSGTYFPVFKQSKWESKKYIDTLPHDVIVACFVGAGLFILFFIFDIIRLVTFIIFTIFRGSVLISTILPIIIFTILLFSYTLRWIYFVLVPIGALQHAPETINILIAELPIYLNFSVFLLLVLWWMEMLLFVASDQRSFLNRMKPAFWAINAVMYTLFLVVLIIYGVVPKRKIESCFFSSKTTSEASKIIGIVYKVAVAVIAFTLATFAIIYGTRLLILITGAKSKSVKSAEGKKRRVIRFTAVLLCVSLGLSLQCAILLYATFSNGINTFAALILVLIAELGPTGVLIFSMSPPTRHVSNPLKNFFWFCFPDDTIERNSVSDRSRRSSSAADKIRLNKSESNVTSRTAISNRGSTTSLVSGISMSEMNNPRKINPPVILDAMSPMAHMEEGSFEKVPSLSSLSSSIISSQSRTRSNNDDASSYTSSSQNFAPSARTYTASSRSSSSYSSAPSNNEYPTMSSYTSYSGDSSEGDATSASRTYDDGLSQSSASRTFDDGSSYTASAYSDAPSLGSSMQSVTYPSLGASMQSVAPQLSRSGSSYSSQSSRSQLSRSGSSYSSQSSQDYSSSSGTSASGSSQQSNF